MNQPMTTLVSIFDRLAQLGACIKTASDAGELSEAGTEREPTDGGSNDSHYTSSPPRVNIQMNE